ncbi:hypothetical protein HDU76_001510 [Blyttiomyces sp. JEL0837]|nr:hypothetical protein HDU76_001510 [Blyttiomyces sp. JEL0837]
MRVQLMKDIKRLPREARLAVKKAVKQFLIIKFDERAKECALRCEGTSYVTYGVPDELLGTFKYWLHDQLSRVFRDFTIEKLEDPEAGGGVAQVGSVAEAPVGGDKMEGVVEGSSEVPGANVEEVNAGTAGAVAASSGEVINV